MSPLNAVRIVLGAFVLLRPRRAAAWWGADPKSGSITWAARVLGGRHLAQAVVLTAHPTPGARAVSLTIDLLHGVSMLVLAAGSSRLRRPALTSAGVAFALATLDHQAPARSSRSGATGRSKPLRRSSHEQTGHRLRLSGR